MTRGEHKKKKCKSNLCIVEMAGWEFLSLQDVSKLGAAKLPSRLLVPNQLSLSVLKICIHRRDVEDLKAVQGRAGHQVEHLTKRVKRFEECHSPLAESFDIRRRKKLSTNTSNHPYKVKYEINSQPVNWKRCLQYFICHSHLYSSLVTKFEGQLYQNLKTGLLDFA